MNTQNFQAVHVYQNDSGYFLGHRTPIKHADILGYGTITENLGWNKHIKAYHYIYSLTEEAIQALNDDATYRRLRIPRLKLSIHSQRKLLFKMSQYDGERSAEEFYLKKMEEELAELMSQQEKICPHCGSEMKFYNFITWRPGSSEEKRIKTYECVNRACQWSCAENYFTEETA